MDFKRVEEKYGNLLPIDRERILKEFVDYFKTEILKRGGSEEKENISEDTPTKIVFQHLLPKRRPEEQTVEIINKEDIGVSEELISEDEVTVKGKLADRRKREEIIMEFKTLLKHNLYTKAFEYMERSISKYSHDIILQRKFVDILIYYGEIDRAIDLLFNILQLHFEQGNIPAMKRIIDHILVLDPTNRRALKLKEKLKL